MFYSPCAKSPRLITRSLEKNTPTSRAFVLRCRCLLGGAEGPHRTGEPGFHLHDSDSVHLGHPESFVLFLFLGHEPLHEILVHQPGTENTPPPPPSRQWKYGVLTTGLQGNPIGSESFKSFPDDSLRSPSLGGA